MNSSTSKDDLLSAVAIGVSAATVAAIGHEAVGHGLGCYAGGGKIALLTSILFTCEGGTGFTDAAGPLGSAIFGLAAAAVLRVTRPRAWALNFLYLSVVINAGWFGGQLVYSAVLVRDDWAFAAAGFGWVPAWRVVAIAAGVAIYAGTVRFLRRWPVRPSTILSAYLTGTISAVIAALLWYRAPIASVREAFLAIGVAPLWILISGLRRPKSEAPVIRAQRSWRWIGASVVLYSLFLLIEARGVGTALSG